MWHITKTLQITIILKIPNILEGNNYLKFISTKKRTTLFIKNIIYSNI